MLDIGRGYDGWVGWGVRVWSLKEARTCAILILIILPGNAVYQQREQGYKMQVHIEAHFVV